MATVTLSTDAAFVLDLHPYRERDLVVALLTRGHGLRRVTARGARARLTRFGGALQTMNEVEATWMSREGGDLGSLREARAVREIFPAVARDPAAGAVAAWIADHLRSFAPEHEEAPLYWRLAVHLRDELLGGTDPRLVAVYTELWVLRIAGIFPRLAACGRCGRGLDPTPGEGESRRDAGGHFLCRECGLAGSVPFGHDSGRALVAMLARPLGQLGPLSAATGELAEVSALCRDVRRAFLGRELVSERSVAAILAG
jgi:DNA repair protein RecO (recombination protein O)